MAMPVPADSAAVPFPQARQCFPRLCSLACLGRTGQFPQSEPWSAIRQGVRLSVLIGHRLSQTSRRYSHLSGLRLFRDVQACTRNFDPCATSGVSRWRLQDLVSRPCVVKMSNMPQCKSISHNGPVRRENVPAGTEFHESQRNNRHPVTHRWKRNEGVSLQTIRPAPPAPAYTIGFIARTRPNPEPPAATPDGAGNQPSAVDLPCHFPESRVTISIRRLAPYGVTVRPCCMIVVTAGRRRRLSSCRRRLRPAVK